MCWLTFFLSLSLSSRWPCRSESQYGCKINRQTSCDLIPPSVPRGSFNPGRNLTEGKQQVHRLGDGLSQTFSPGCWGHCRLQALVYIWASAGKQCSECGVSGEVGGLTDWWTGSVDFWLVGQRDWLVNWVIGWLTGCINGWVGDWEVGLSDQLIDWFGRWSDR